jgi:transcriptional regulator with XRE-family HTH domain
MANRTINTELLKRAIRLTGNGRFRDLAKASAVSVSWLEKAVSGNYSSAPRELTRQAICKATQLSEDELFPLVKGGSRRRAK